MVYNVVPLPAIVNIHKSEPQEGDNFLLLNWALYYSYTIWNVKTGDVPEKNQLFREILRTV